MAIKSAVIPPMSRSSFSESETDQKPLVEVKTETTPKPSQARHFYALYSLKLNRVNTETSPKQRPASTILQMLDREATLNKDFSLTLISNDLKPSNESYLRECLAKKIEKGTLYASANSGNISAFNLGFDRDGNSYHAQPTDLAGAEGAIESICYYFLHRPAGQSDNEYLICFVLHDSDFNLDLFRNELDYYIESCVQPYLDDRELKELSQLEASLRNWYLYAVNYLARTLSLFKEDIAVFIDQILANGGVSYENFDKLLAKIPEDSAETGEFCQLDLELFYTSLFCTYLVQSAAASSPNKSSSKTPADDSNLNNSSFNASINASMSRSVDGEALVINLIKDAKTVSLSKTDCSAFSRECAKSLLAELESSSKVNPFQMKQIIETYKLKLIQELNTLNRLLRKAESHYYDLYKVYLYLKQSPMTDILVKMYKNCQSDQPKVKQGLSSLMLTFNVVIDFYKQQTPREA